MFGHNITTIYEKKSYYEQTYHDAIYNREWRKCAEENRYTSQLKKVFQVLSV